MNLASLEIKVIDFFKTNKITLPIYRSLKTSQNRKRFRVDSINRFSPVRVDSTDVRYNLVLPTLRKTRVFAGISSALSFFLQLTNNAANCRIIVIGNEEYNSKTTYHIPGYEHSVDSQKQLMFVSDKKIIDIGINDIFVLTSWKTAISFLPILHWQKNEFENADRKVVYLIQDYEPGFFSWSSEYVLAESTYSDTPEDIIAVFNSFELYSFFNNRGYRFGDVYYFRPVLNSVLKDKLVHAAENDNIKRKKRILVYGRPSEDRNAFEIIRYSLELWSCQYKKATEWEIISLGEGFSDIELANNTIVSKGKVTLDEYAEYMLSAYAGVSLMVSPHPSYPPLEMSTFGVRTITNKFEGKDLGSFNNNIISVNNCSPTLITNTLLKVCEEYETYKPTLAMNEEYLDGKGLDFVAQEVGNKILELIR